jgi:hypothetical protein
MKRLLLAITFTLACTAISHADQSDPNDPYNPDNPFRLPGIITQHADGSVDRDGTPIGTIQVDPVTGERRFVPTPQ